MSAVITAQPGRKFRAAEPESRRTFQPIRRGSRWTNHRERWASLSRKEANLRIFALERYQVTTRKAGQRFGAEGTISVATASACPLRTKLRTAGQPLSLSQRMTKRMPRC